MSKRVELYNFSHGQHRDFGTGKFIPLQPNKLGRPLTHEEMDYNMDYMEQTMGGYKIFGSAPDTTLNASDIDKVLILHRITNDDFDVQRYLDKGFELGDYVWVPVEGGDGYTSGEACTIDINVSTSGPSEFARATSSIFVTVTGATGSVLIQINSQIKQPDGIVGNIYRFDGFSAGTYTVTAIDTDFAGTQCSSSELVTIEQQADPCIGFEIDGFSTTLSGTDEVLECNLDLSLFSVANADFGQSNGQIVVELTGIGSSALQWTLDGNGIVPETTSNPGFFILTAAAGSHIIVVYEKDNPDCSQQLSVFVSQNPDSCFGFTLGPVTHTDSGGYECDITVQSLTSTDSGINTTIDCSSFLVSSTNSQSSGGYDCADFELTGVNGQASGGYDCNTFNIFEQRITDSGGYDCNTFNIIEQSITDSGGYDCLEFNLGSLEVTPSGTNATDI